MHSQTRPTVWVLKEQVRRDHNGSAPMDYTPAYRFGNIEFITDFDLPLHDGSSLGRAWHKAVDAALARMDAHRDYIILTGQPFAIMSLGMKLSQHFTRIPNLLVWRREQACYVPVDPNTNR